jgi:hypothetical protein
MPAKMLLSLHLIMRKKLLLYLSVVLLVGGIATFYILNRDKKDKIKPDLQNFAISNPDEIDKIFMVQKGGQPILLSKIDGTWFLNDSIKANEQKVNMLLVETACKLTVTGPVPKTARNNVITKMAATGTKVEFWKGTEKVKTYFVGGTTPDQMGTHMWVEGAQDPYVVNIPGFNGYLNSRYQTDPIEWYSKALFKIANSDIQSIELNYPAHPEWSFGFNKKDQNIDITVDGINNGKNVNPAALLGYFGLFNEVYAEGFPENVNPRKIDSLLRSTPFAILTLTPIKGKKTVLTIHKKEAQDNSQSLFDKNGNRLVYDSERYYAFVNNSARLLFIQDLVFKNILVKYQDFITK